MPDLGFFIDHMNEAAENKRFLNAAWTPETFVYHLTSV